METIKKDLFELLKTIRGNGSFETNGIKNMISPGLRVKGIGEIALPISATQASEIIKKSKKAPFGKGSKTITDTAVRRAWEVDAGELSFHNEDWKILLQKVLEKVKVGLGIEDNPTSASLYKLLIYEAGGFFLMHKDSEKEAGMFGTLVIGLPSVHTGGELTVRFDGKEKTINFSVPCSNYKIPYTAFFADCEHELKPITSGYRIALVYNLIQNSTSQKLGQSYISPKIDEMATLLKSVSKSTSNKPKAILLDHQYTPANFELESLKQNDRPRAQLLIEAAKKAGCFATLGLVTHYKLGESEGGEYDYDYRYSYKNRGSDGGTIGEIIEKYTTIENWGKCEIPPLGRIRIEEEDLLCDYKPGEGDPIEVEEEGYTGNAGMTVEYWYHYGAVIFWPRSIHLQLLMASDVDVSLKWLNYYYEQWDNPELDSIKISMELLGFFDKTELKGWHYSEANFNIVALILLRLKNEAFVKENCQALLTRVFKKISVNNWVSLMQLYSPVLFTNIVNEAVSKDDVYKLSHVLEILKSLLLLRGNQQDAYTQSLLKAVPDYLGNIELSKLKETEHYNEDENTEERKATIVTLLETIIDLSHHKEKDINWRNKTVDEITKSLPRTYVNTVLMVVFSNQKGVLANRVKQLCKLDLTSRISIRPDAPYSWKRPVPVSKRNAEIWDILRSFLQSENERVFDYKKGESYRREMEAAIKSVNIDLKTETITKGSPHTLRITKTQAAYELALKHWKEDLAILERLDKNR